MKIILSGETIKVEGWLRTRFSASAQEITDVRVMADEAVPKGAWNRMKLSLGRTPPEVKLRAVMVFAGDQAVTLDAYYDDSFESAVDWLSQHGWNVESAILNAIRTPLVRVSVDRNS
jgi:hypothetical protein